MRNLPVRIMHLTRIVRRIVRWIGEREVIRSELQKKVTDCTFAFQSDFIYSLRTEQEGDCR